ncbi:MAG: bestrophin family ion channel [Bacteroidota bacterium]
MVIYNPKDWWKLIFAFHKSDTFRIMLPGILGMVVYSTLIIFLEKDVFDVSFKNTTSIHSLVGFALSMLLVFRTNTAYERWWEGRKLWGGFVNSSRNLAFKLNPMITDKVIKTRIRILLVNYLNAAKEQLRKGVSHTDLQPTDRYSIADMMKDEHVPNCILKYIHIELYELLKNGTFTQEQMLYINAELQSLGDNMGACERIKKTPIPYSYSIFLKKIIFIYIASMPFGFAMEFGYWTAPIVALLFYVFASIELIAEEIEDPFGTDANDLPTDQITDTIEKNLEEILG